MPKQRTVHKWSKLDNAATIFPSNSTLADPKVFRFSATLTADIDPIVLQKALNDTLPLFPHFSCIIRKGLFWHFFEPSTIKAVVEEEHLPILSPLYTTDRRSLLFRVNYYKNRIILEVYHAICDGTGAAQFHKTLLYHYLLTMYPQTLADKVEALEYNASIHQKLDNSFEKHFSGKGKTSSTSIKKGKRSYKIFGSRLPAYQLRIIEGNIPVDKLLTLARSYDTTLTVLLAALLIQAIHRDMPKRMEHLPVVLTVPVNLRNYFESYSARNFFGLFHAQYDFSTQPKELSEIIITVKDQFKDELTTEKLEMRMNEIAKLEHNLINRVVPLFIKDKALNYFGKKAEKSVTCAFSNIGKITMPKLMEDYVNSFHISCSTSKLQTCLCSYKNNMSVVFTSPFSGSNVEMAFFRSIVDLGVPVSVNSNLVDM